MYDGKDDEMEEWMDTPNEDDLTSSYEYFFGDLEDMPKRSRSHELKTESENYLRSKLPSSWIIDTIENDYGIDFRVKVALKGRVTGIEYNIQLKGTDKPLIHNGNIVVRLKVSTINYLLSQNLPTMIVIYNASAKKAYYIWIDLYEKHILQNFTPDWRKKKTLSIKIPQSHYQNIANKSGIVSYLFLKKFPSEVDSRNLINFLYNHSGQTIDNIINVLQPEHFDSIETFFKGADVENMFENETLYWDDILFVDLVWNLSEDIKTAALQFAYRMAITLMQKEWYSEASEVIWVLSGIDEDIGYDLCVSWWKHWARSPELDLGLNMMNRIDCLSEICLLEFIKVRFGNGIKHVKRLLEETSSFSYGTNLLVGIDYLNAQEFLNWLEQNAYEYKTAMDKIVDQLGFDQYTREKLLNIIDEEYNEYLSEIGDE